MSNSFQPFYVEVDGPQHSRMLQEIGFDEGYGWGHIHKQDIKYSELINILTFGYNNTNQIKFNNDYKSALVDHKLEDYTLEEFRQALNGNYDWEETIVAQGYEVEFNDEKSTIEVGCMTYYYEDIRCVYENIEEAHKGLYPDFNIKIEHSKEGVIPFKVLETIYNRITD